MKMELKVATVYVHYNLYSTNPNNVHCKYITINFNVWNAP